MTTPATDSPPIPPASRALAWFAVIAPAVAAAALCVVALYHGVQAVEGVAWPYFYDALRDIGVAQSILDGRYPEDHIFLGETLWFNPLVGALVAAGTWLTDLPTHVVNVHLGPVANLLTPVALFLLAAALCGRWAALGTLLCVLMLNAQGEFLWATATYSPWLFAPHLAQGLFALTFLLFWQAERSGRRRWFVLTGVALGVTFMGHAAPAVVLGGTMVLVTLYRAVRERDAARRHTADLGVLLLVGFVASLPYTYSILYNYQFQIINTLPSLNVEQPVRLARLPEALRQAVSWHTGIALLGFGGILLARAKRIEHVLLLCWTLVVALFLVQVYAWRWLDRARRQIPQIVPGHHFLICLTLLEAVYFGYGLWWLIQAPLRVLRRRPGLQQWAHGVAALAVVTGLAVALYPAYADWNEFTEKPRERLWYGDLFEERETVYAWILEHTDASDVFLCEDQLGLIVVGPAGRKLVGTMLIFANPYVDSARRLADREAMFDAMRAKDARRFRRLARVHGVRFALLRGKEIELAEASLFNFLDPVLRADPLLLYEVHL